MTGTPCVSRYSRVRPMSRIDLAPAQTTATGVCASSCRSAEMSKVSGAPRCTPPMPPVANTRIPAMAAMIMVEATVVAPIPLRASTKGISRRLHLVTAWPARPSASRASPSSPTLRRPSMMAMVAGTAPLSRTTCSTRRAVSTFCG